MSGCSGGGGSGGGQSGGCGGMSVGSVPSLRPAHNSTPWHPLSPSRYPVRPPIPPQAPKESRYKVKTFDPHVAKTFAGHEDWVWSVLFLPDSGQLLSASLDGSIRVWDMVSGEQAGEMMMGPQQAVCAVAMLVGGRRIASAGEDESISIWDLEGRRTVGEPLRGHFNSVRSIDVSPDGRCLASGSWDDTVKLWDLGSETVVEGSINSKLATGLGDGFVRVWKWNSDTREEVGKPIQAHDGAIRNMLWNGKGVDEVLILGTDDGMIRRWNAGKGEAVGEPLHAHSGPIYGLALSNDDKILASASLDYTVKLWNAMTWEQLATFTHNSQVFGVAFSPDDKFMASACADHLVYLWDVPSFDNLRGEKSFPAVVRPREDIQETVRIQGGLINFPDVPATSRPPVSGQSPKAKKRFVDRFKFWRRSR
ncbi:WD40 repeat-like protein [Paxillus ammoniavirescens]|nr:WD40 repeat-like protein [Paxillus ammoniavirescens]